MKSLTNTSVSHLVLEKPWPKLHVLSDLHMETGPYEFPPNLDFDILIAAGDIGPVERALPWLAAIGKPVIYVLGNHERYGTDLDAAVAQARQLAAGTQVHVLERDALKIGGIRFLGATLWADFGELSPELIACCLRRSNDYNYIQAQRYASGRLRKWVERLCRRLSCNLPEPGKFHPVIAYLEHKAALAWLKKQLKQDYAGATVVVTHHAPTYGSLRAFGVREEYLERTNWEIPEKSLLYVGNYASDLSSVLQEYRDDIDLWCHGHLHRHMDFIDEGVRVLCNPRGYHYKPPTKDSEFWFEARPTNDAIARSAQGYARNPYSGNGYGFDPELVVDLADGFARPLGRAVQQYLVEMCRLYRSAKRIAPHLSLDETVPAECMRIVFGDLCSEFAQVVERVSKQQAIHVDHHICEDPKFLHTIRTPPKPYRPFATPLRPLDFQRDYLAQLISMRKFIIWTIRLRYAAKSQLLAWQATANQMMDAVEDLGISAMALPPEPTALRYADHCDYIVLFIEHSVNTERAAKEIYRLRDAQVLSRRFAFDVRGIHDLEDEELEGLRHARALESAIRVRDQSVRG